MTDMCSLMDTRYRIHRSSKKDTSRLNKLVQHEKVRQARSFTLLKDRSQQLVSLANNANDRSQTINYVLSGIKTDYGMQMKKLSNAQAEEDMAKKLYEACVKRKNDAALAASQMYHTYNTLQQQRHHALRVTTCRTELEQYNSKSSTSRIQIISSLQNLLNYMSQQYVQNSIDKDMYDLYTKLFTWWKSHNKHANSDLSNNNNNLKDESNIRLGIELIRLCKQHFNYSEGNNMLGEYE